MCFLICIIFCEFKSCVLIHELLFNMYIYITYSITVLILNNLIHKKRVTYILNIIKTI